MNWKVRLKRGGNALVLLVLLFLSNFFVGRVIYKFIMTPISETMDVNSLLFIALPGPLSTFLIFLTYRKLPFNKKIDLPSAKLNGYLFIQGTFMVVIEPIATLISVVATDASGTKLKEMLIGYSIVWVPVNVFIWIFFIISLMVNEKIIKLPPL